MPLKNLILKPANRKICQNNSPPFHFKRGDRRIAHEPAQTFEVAQQRPPKPKTPRMNPLFRIEPRNLQTRIPTYSGNMFDSERTRWNSCYAARYGRFGKSTKAMRRETTRTMSHRCKCGKVSDVPRTPRTPN